MEAMRESWTDARLDDFAAHTDQRFDQVDRRFDDVERRMEKGFEKVDSDIGQLRAEMNARFDSLQRMIFQFSGGLVVALIGFMITQV